MEFGSNLGGSNYFGSNEVERRGNGKRGFDFGKYYGLFFDQLVLDQLASCRRAVGLY
jgi:hypothetical protein